MNTGNESVQNLPCVNLWQCLSCHSIVGNNKFNFQVSSNNQIPLFISNPDVEQ